MLPATESVPSSSSTSADIDGADIGHVEHQLPEIEDRRPKSFASQLSWLLVLVGMAVGVFSIVALSSAGRIDVIDAQTRYEVGRSLVEHGDSIVRNKDVWFAVFTGRNGERYTNYRFPHSLVAAAAITLADATGPVREVRRQFFFALSGAAFCGLIAVVFANWFRSHGHGRFASLAWAAGGIFCTPLWFYGTTAYDDVLGTLVVLAAILVAYAVRYRETREGEGERGREGEIPESPTPPLSHSPALGAEETRCQSGSRHKTAIVSGLLLGLAFNCKPPLVLFLPAVVAALWRPEQSSKDRWLQARIVFFCAAMGVIAYEAYDLWKFPPSTWPGVAVERGEYVALWPGVPLAGLLSLLISPGMGALWYWPAIVIALCGLGGQVNKRFAVMTGLSCLAFLCFIASIRFFSGEPAWGPRYLTPVFGVLWLFVPAGVARLRWPKAAVLLAASFAVQLAGLSVEPIRFFSGDSLDAAEGLLKTPWNYFRLDRSQLLARPLQVWEIVSYDGPAPAAFTPAKLPTLPLIIWVKTDKRMHATDYAVLSSLRPWWLTFRSLPSDERPVDLRRAVEFLLIFGGSGLAIVGVTLLMPLRPARSGVVNPSQPIDAEWPGDAAAAV